MKNKFIKDFLPPKLIKLLKGIPAINPGPHWSGDFISWEEALKKSTGYDAAVIVEKVKSSLLKVKNGEAVYERDSVLFDEIQYTWPVLTGLLWVYAQQNRLDLIDFGGSLGSTYYQNRKFLAGLDNLRWSIIEQKTFTDVGIESFQTEQLKFYYSIESCLKENKPNCVLLSSVLPYISEPYGLLAELFLYNFDYIILDKMPFIDGGRDRITLQKTPSTIYPASYPAWFLSESKFRKFIESKYVVVEEFMDKEEVNIKSVYKGMILKIK